ncbi:MAG TPA: hypothetical protein PKE00_14395 [Planctomycetota bacterium]|nr:hypothetical protein [Planctomycetota bacterium]
MAYVYMLEGPTPLRRAALLQLREEVKHERLEIHAGLPLVMEMAEKVARPQLFRRALRELRRLTHGRLMTMKWPRVVREVRTGRPLRRREVMFSASELKPLWTNANIVENAADQATFTRRVKDQFFQREVVAKERVAELQDVSRSSWKNHFRSDPHSEIADWCIHDFRKQRAELGLPRDEGSWLHPKSFPTAWAWMSAKLGHIYIVGLDAVGKGKVEASAGFDRDHVADAAYADVFVTDDKRLTRILQAAQYAGFKVMTTDEFARALLSGAPLS